MDSQSQLIAWCRKQRETLEDLTAMGDLIAFSDSFQKNVPVMDSNFLVIVDQSEPLMDNPKVQDALQAVNREWVRLCLMNYEKLQDGLREAHVSSNLESLCSTWMKAAEDRARQILLAAQGFLMSPGTDTDATVEGLRSTCEELLKHHEAFGVIATHLSDYSIRDECVRPHLNSLKHELTTPVTTTVLSCPVYDDYEGRHEYKNRLEELREWVDVKSQKGTYIRLMDRLEDTRRMIEEYADALFPEDEEVPTEEPSTDLDIMLDGEDTSRGE
ncbi:hypothetical protein STCU_08363 [Strigomonas culicis]|uniref:Uncharacterized protein n=1 Tax=Strigomonas culicis TaxID=28005 RepID=S9V595_9TRYP|nr:hypothetical protein STCU_08363 [Strigomonas culicis]|eukprot:EPY22071.1 hypothetical protein STCU_08363 [Strigomonas culicis]